MTVRMVLAVVIDSIVASFLASLHVSDFLLVGGAARRVSWDSLPACDAMMVK